MKYQNPEFVIANAHHLRLKTRVFLYIVTLLAAGGAYSGYNWYETQRENTRLDNQIASLNHSYSERIASLSSLIDLFEGEFLKKGADISGLERNKVGEYREKLQAYKRRMEVEQIADKIRLLASHVDTEYAMEIADSIHKWATPYGNDPDMLVALAYVESHFKPAQISNKGALGLTQVMPAWVNCENPRKICNELSFIQSVDDLANNVDKNIRAGSAILKFMLQQSDGKWDHALASYNLGWNKVSSEVGAGVELDYIYAKKVLRVYTRLKQMELHQTASADERPSA